MLTKTELNKLISERTTPCVSIIAPTHRLSPGRMQDHETVSKQVEAAKQLLRKKFSGTPVLNEIYERIDSLSEQIDYVHPKDGIGIFVSPSHSKMVSFEFPVSNKVKAGDSFCLKDLLFNFENALNYYVIAISKKSVKLYKAGGEEFEEIKNKDFPLSYFDDYEYAKTSHGNSYGNTLKSYERDKSVLQDIRLKSFLRIADQLLEKYISNIPLIVAGGTKEISDFLNITKHENNVIGKVKGNYIFKGETLLAKLATAEVQHYVRSQNKLLIDEISESIGRKMAVYGINDVWKAAAESKGLELVVEKDYECYGYITNNGQEVKQSKPSLKKYVFEPDVTEKVIRLVMEKGGKIVFVDKDDLKDFDVHCC